MHHSSRTGDRATKLPTHHEGSFFRLGLAGMGLFRGFFAGISPFDGPEAGNVLCLDRDSLQELLGNSDVSTTNYGLYAQVLNKGPLRDVSPINML